MRPAVFLDRDDTLIACRGLPPAPPPAAPGDLVNPSLVELLPGVFRGCQALSDAGFALVVVSNQGCVARGGATLAQVEAVNTRLRTLLPMLESVYFCPFHPKGTPGGPFTREHPWRKPSPGMILASVHDLSLDLAASWLVGDAQRDLDAGHAAGLSPARCLRVEPGGNPTFLDQVAVILEASRATSSGRKPR